MAISGVGGAVRRICLYEWSPDSLLPLAWLRPVWDLRAGALTLEERVRRVFPSVPLRYAGRPALEPLWKERRGESLTDPVPANGTLFLEAGVGLGAGSAESLLEIRGPCRLRTRDGIVGYVPADGAPDLIPGGVETGAALARAGGTWREHELDLPVLRALPDLVRHQSRLLLDDLAIAGGRALRPEEVPGVAVLGGAPVWLSGTAVIDPGTTLDGRRGAIWIGDGVEVTHGTWLKGPAAVGAGSILLGGVIGPIVALGPHCRVRGEVTDTIVQGYSNKVHDGFIGHSYVGEWVNLGALTTCSNLKNNYSEVRLDIDGRGVPTGLEKLGVLIADHAKTAIGSLLSTGTVIGVGANVFGGAGLGGKYVPMFAWGVADGGRKGSYDLERFLEAARRVMSRRNASMSPAYEALLRRVFASC
jgi:UDP-N-acetylglucosamine diphosphorylase/glucosamine-1-phosphate N-acetyltransferase